jgi:hypothetical protein
MRLSINLVKPQIQGLSYSFPGSSLECSSPHCTKTSPPAGSKSRAEFYEQRQYSIPFPLLEGEEPKATREEEAEIENALHLVYAWDISFDLKTIGLKLVCPNERSGKHRWQHFFPEAQMRSVGDESFDESLVLSAPSTAPIAIAAAAANTDLDLSPRAATETREQVKPSAAKLA